jgi:hypothetical protein
VVDHLPEEHKADVRRKLQNAYSMADYGDAKRALERLQHELMHLNPSAARSLEEGLEETLTVHKLRVADQLRRTVLHRCHRVGLLPCRDRLTQREALAARRSDRTLGGFRLTLVAEQQFRKVIGYRQIPLLLSSMANALSQKPVAKKAHRVAYGSSVANFQPEFRGNFTSCANSCIATSLSCSSSAQRRRIRGYGLPTVCQ